MNSWVHGGITPQALERALGRVEEAILAAADADALLARREAGLTTPNDATLAATFCGVIVASQAEDGSWDGNLVTTAEMLMRLAALAGPDAADAVLNAGARGVAWLKSRRGKPGRFGDGCTPDRHRMGLCHHFLGGFFAPEPPIDEVEGLVLANGARVPGGAAGQLAASCLALRSVLRWEPHGPDASLHLDGLLRLLEWDRRTGGRLVPLDAVPAIALALLEAADRDEFRDAAKIVLDRIVQVQRADGSWPELDTFYILEVLLAALDAGFHSDAVDAALLRAAGLLALTQQPDGQWERDTVTARTRIGLRTLRHATRLAEGKTEPRNGDA